ncbi:SdpI family protein [Maritalea mediterranea]|uniref:SdpI family protein n=1 Tax=Maritalea mediterranea TaxID=2909667 RepID=A0ABS9E8Y4_9HYPH|nr:SdpI family protein [Maritalea mediterranea]MCF4098220.1 SdpI family protein [Maritalea mediterranea]
MTTNRVLNRVHVAQLIVVCAIAGLGYLTLNLNQSVPIHWNIWGEVDNVWPARWALLIGPALALLFLGLFTVISAKEQGSWVAPLTTSILALFILLETIMLLTAHDVALNVPRIVTIAVGLLLAVVGNYLPKSQPNHLFGIRYPWTLKNDSVWAQTHLFAGWFFMMVGIGCALFAAVIDVAAPFYLGFLLAGIVAAMIIITAYSYNVSKRLG